MSSADRVQFMSHSTQRDSSARRRSRALCTCDFDVPSAIPMTLADFAMLEPLHVVQHERGAAAFRQLRHRPLEIHLRHRALGEPMAAPHRAAPARRRARRSSGWPVRSGCADSRGTGSRPADTATCRAPTRRGTVQLPVRREEDLLQHVLRVGRVAEHADGHAVEPPRMRPVELLERAQVALAAPLDQGQILLPDGPVGPLFAERPRGSDGPAGPFGMLDDTGGWRRCRHFALFFAVFVADFGQRRARKSRIRSPETRTPSALSRARFISETAAVAAQPAGRRR